ncbi:MAG TPA: hypothetical protein VH518_12380, partial [Tepidisphaeraceae bacterium]
ERRPTTSSTAPAQPVAAAPASSGPKAAATTQSFPPALIWIDKQPFEFPSARLVLRNKNDQVLALLFSDDPPNAIEDSYRGNSYYLEMAGLEIPPETSSLAGASWTYKAPNSEREESVAGIFLEGRRRQLQPFDVRVSFDGAVSPVTVRINGTFLMFDSDNLDEKAPGKLVDVHAELMAEVRTKGASAAGK